MKLMTAISFFSLCAWSFTIGDEVPLKELPEQTCMIKLNSGKFCSATIASDHHLLTASHCFKGDKNSKVLATSAECHLNDGSIEKFELDTTKQKIGPLSMPYHDTAIVTSQSKINIAPMPLATKSLVSEYQFFSEMFECIAVGYGDNNEETFGIKKGVWLRTFIVEDSKIVLTANQFDPNPRAKEDYEIALEDHKYYRYKQKAALGYGDSGGTTACRVKGTNQWILFAINSMSSMQDLDLDDIADPDFDIIFMDKSPLVSGQDEEFIRKNIKGSKYIHSAISTQKKHNIINERIMRLDPYQFQDPGRDQLQNYELDYHLYLSQ